MKPEKSQIKIGIILNYINLGLGNLIPLFYTPIMLNLLGKSEYGLYKLSSNVTSYLGLISLGIGAAVTRYLIKAQTEEGQEAEEKIFGLFMVIFQIISVLSLVVGIILTLNLDIWYADALTSEELSRMKILVFLMVLNTAISFSASPYMSVVTAHERFVFLQCMNIITTCVAPIINIVLLYLGYASIGMAASTLILGVLVRIIYVFYVRRSMHLRARYRDLPTYMLKEILMFSFWIFVGNVVGQLYNATDTVMIGMIPALATTGVAVYNVGGVFNSMVFSLTTGVSSLLSPKANRMVFGGASEEELTELSIRVGRIQGFIISLLVLGFISFGRPFIHFYVGDGFEDAYWVAVLMMIPNMIPLVQSMCLSIIIAQNKHKFRSLVYLLIAIINVVGTWFAMKRWGIIGAAAVTAAAMLLGHGIIMNWYYARRTGLFIHQFWKEVGMVYIVPVCLCIVTLILDRYVNFYNMVCMLLGIVLFTVLYMVLSWKFVFNTYEKNLLSESVRKIQKRIMRKKDAGNA